MDRQEAIRRMVTDGKRDRAIEIVRKHTAWAKGRYDEIRNDDTYSESHKQHLLAVTYVQAQRGLDEDLEWEARRAISSERQDTEAVFGIADLPGDRASLAISQRDAGDRVAAVTEAVELRRLLERATRIGDEVLARAVAEKAMEQGDVETLNQFMADRPQLEGAIERLWKIKRSAANSLPVTMELMGLRPDELRRMSAYAIDDLARGAA